MPAAARISSRRRSRAPPSAPAHAVGAAMWLVGLPLARPALYGPAPRHSAAAATLKPPGTAGALPRRRRLASLPGEGPSPEARVLFLYPGSRLHPIRPSGALAPGPPARRRDVRPSPQAQSRAWDVGGRSLGRAR